MRYFLFIFSALLFVSCSVKKRTHRDGYYIDWVFKKKSSAPVKQNDPVKKLQSADEPVEVVTVRSTTVLNLINESEKTIWPGDTCGDVIVFKSGDEVIARVTEITDDKIKYKRCDNVNGPVFVVNKSTVSSVRYTNGVLEKIEAPITSSTPNTNAQPTATYYGQQKVHPLAILSLISLLIGSFLAGAGVIIALVLSSRAIREINANPKKWKGLTLAKVVRSISLVLMILILLVILIFLSTI
jgi:hypothetical protein